MDSDIRIPDSVTIKKQEDEDSYLINEQSDRMQKQIYKMEEEKQDLLLNQPPGVGDFPSSIDTIDAELNDGIKAKDNEILPTSLLEQVGNEEKCRSDPCPTSIPKEDETEMPDNEKQFHKCDHAVDAKEEEEYEAGVVEETCENSMQKIDEQEALHDIKTNSPVAKVEEPDITVEKEESSKDEINVDQNVEEMLDRQTFVDDNDKPQNIHEERNGSELELKKEALAPNPDSTVNILNDNIEAVTVITNAEDSPCSRGILDEEDIGMKTELKVGDCTEISCDSKVEKINSEATETSRETELEKEEKEPSTSNADNASDVAMPEVQNDKTMEIGISADAKLEMLSVSEDTDEGSKQEGTLEEGVNLNGPSDEFTNQTETREESTQDNSIPNEGDDVEFSEQKLDSINVERQVDLQEMTESTTNENREVEELTATVTGDYIDESQNSKAVQDPEHKFFEENDPAKENTLVALNEGLEENKTETSREISETTSNEVEKQISNLEETSSGIEKEHIEAAYCDASEDDVPTEEELSPSNMNEVHDSANELSDNNGNDVQLKHSLLNETEKVEDQRVHEVLEFENEQKIQEANNAMTEEEKYVDNVSEAYPKTERTTGEIESLDKTVTNEMISEINSSSVEDEKICGSGLDEKIETSDIRVYVPEELESTEDTDTSVQSTIKDNKTEEQIAVDDALTAESRNALIEEEIVDKNFQEQDYEEAPLNLSGEDENLSPNEIEKKKTYDEEGSDNIDTENIKEEALVKSKDACFSPESNEVDGSSEKKVENLREEDCGRSILDEGDEKYVGEEVTKHYEDENESIEISKGEILCEVENVTGEKFITNEKNEDVETHDKCFNTFKAEEDVAFSQEHDLLATKEASMEESRNDSTCPAKEVVADNDIDDTTKDSERQAMVAEEVAEKVLDEGESKEEPVNFLVARESETETLSESDQIISAAEKEINQIVQKDDSGVELMQPLVIGETETEVLRQNAHNETLAVEELEETKQTETEACFDSTMIAEKDTGLILQKDETNEEVKQLQFTNKIEEKASCDNTKNETLVAREDVEQISHQDETKEELEQLLETKKFESEASCGDAEIIKLEEYTDKDLVKEVMKESETSCGDIEITVSKEDEEQVLLKEPANEIEQPQAPNETETQVFSKNAYKEIWSVEALQETKKIETEASSDSTIIAEKDTEHSLENAETSEEVQQLQLTNEIEEKTFCDDAEEILVTSKDTTQIFHQDEPKELDALRETQKIESEEHCGEAEVIAPEEDTKNETSVAREDVEQISHQDETKEELEQLLENKKFESEASWGNAEIIKLKEYTNKDLVKEVIKESEASCRDREIIVPKEDEEQVLPKEAANEIEQSQAPNETETQVFSENAYKEILPVEELQETKKIETETSFDSTMIAEKDTEHSLENAETSEEVQQLQLTNEVEEKILCGGAEEILVAREDNTQIFHQDEPKKKELDDLRETQKIESEEHCGDAEVIAPEEDTQPVMLKEVAKELDQSLGINENEMDAFSGNSEIVVNEKDTKQISRNIESEEEFENILETEEIETEDNNPVITAKDTENWQKDETREEVKELLLTSELEAKTICENDEKETLVTEDDIEKDTGTNLQTYETKEEMVESINAIETETEVFHENIETVVAEKDIDQICQKNESTEEIEQYLVIKESNTEGCGDSSGIVIDERNFEKALQKEESREELEQLQASTEIKTEAEKLCGNTEIDTVMGERGSEEPFEIVESSEKFEQSIVTLEPAVKTDVDEDIITSIRGEETAKKEVIETAGECNENVMLDEISSIKSQSQESISEEITTKDFQEDGNDAIGYKELEIEDISSIEKENTASTLSSTSINETITESSEKENSDTVKLKQELQLEFKEQIEVQNSKEISADNIQLQEDPDTKALDEKIHIEERSENLAQNFFFESKVYKEEMQEEIQEKEKADSSFVSILSEEKLSKEELEIKELTDWEGTNLGPSNINGEEERNSKPENQKDTDISILAYESENQIEYETDDNVHPTTIKNDQEVIIEEATLHHTPGYKLTNLSTLSSKELDIETTEASNATEKVTIDAESEDIINEEAENPFKEQEVENKLVQEADESFAQRDLSEMESSDIVQNSAPSEVQQQRDEELHPPPEIDRRSTSDSNEVADLNKEELIDFENQHEVIDDKNYLESEEAGEHDSKQILLSEKSEEIEQLLESKIKETEAFVAEKNTGEGHQETEVIETARECKENVISDEIDSTKSQSQETVNEEITLEYFQKDGTDAIGYKEPETEHNSLTEQENFKENTTAILSSMPINETTTESSENENSDALKLKQELQLESKEQIEVENWNELQKDLDTKEAINEEIHLEERSENVAQNLLSESKVYETETQEGTQEKEKSDSSFLSITGRDLSEMGSDQKSAPSEVQKQRDPELHPPPEIERSTSESNEVANLDKEELTDFQNQYEVVDDKNNLQSKELEEIIFENQYVVVDDKNNLESEEAAKDDSKPILQNEKSMEEIEQLMETKITETEALVAEKDTGEGLKETEMGVAEKDTREVLKDTEPCVVEKDSSASNEMGNLKKEELDCENQYEIVDEKNNLELEGETSKKEEPSKEPNEYNAANLNSLNDQYSIGEKPTSELHKTCKDFEETSTSIELEEATAGVEVVSQEAGQDDSTVQINELPTDEVFDTTSTGKEAKEETLEDVDTIKIHSPELTELDTFEKNFEDDQAKETNLESNIQIEATEALNEETSNQESNENYVTSSVSEVSDKEVKEVREDELITDDCKPSIANSESENSVWNVAESEEKDMVGDKTVLDSTAIDNEPESEQKDITDVLDFSAEERRGNDIATVVEGKEGGEYETEEKLGILTEETCTKEGSENLVASTESKLPDQDVEEEISINDYDSPSAKIESDDLSLKVPESTEQEDETKEDQSVMETKPEDISILCKEKEEDTTTLVVKRIDNREHDIEETTPTKVVVEKNILTHSFDFRSDDNLPESVEIPSDKHQLVETETTEKVEDIVVRDEASYGNFEPEEKLSTPAEDTCTKEGNENLTASIDSKVFDEEIQEEIISKEEISTSDFDSASTKFESGDLTLNVVESEEQKIQTIKDQSAMEIKPEDSIKCKENDDETTTLAVESIANQDHDIEETIPTKVVAEENILTRSFDFTSDSNLEETVEIPSSENQLIASATSEKVEKNIVRDEASYGNFELEATSPTQTIEEKLDTAIEDTCTKEGNENLVASPQSKVPDDEIKEITSKEEISINDYDSPSPSTKFERKDLSLKVDESEEQEIQTKEDQTSIDAKQEDEDIVTLAVKSMDDREPDIEETASKEVVVDESVLIRSFDSTGDELQDSAEISSDKHQLIAAETTERVENEETEHVMEEVHKAVAEEAFLTTSSDTLNDNDRHDSLGVSSEEHLLTASEMIEEKVSKSGIDDSPDKFNELELSKGKDEIGTFVGKENDIIEQEDGYNSKGNTLDLGEEKAPIVFREGKEVVETKEKSLLEEKNVEIDDSSETLECATELPAELVNEDQNSQSKMSEAEEATKDIKQPTSVEQQILEQSQEDEITSAKKEATVTNEQVYDEIIKTDSRENNEEQVIENKSTLEELPMISSEGAENESCEVSEDYGRAINSNEKVGTIQSESEEDNTSEWETTITETTQEKRVVSECMESPVNISVSIAEESEEKITGEMRNDLEETHSPRDKAMVETRSTSAEAMEADSSFETNAKVAPSLLETQKLMDNPNTSNIPLKISAQASEYEQEVCIDDILSKSTDSEIKEKHQGIAVTPLNTTENEYEKTVEETVTSENKVPSEEALEQNKLKEDHNQILLNENAAEEINEPLKSTREVSNQDVVKLSEVIDEGATEKEIADEGRKKESFTDEENNEHLQEEETEVYSETQGKTEEITKEKESRVDMLELRGPENSADNNIISKDIYQTKEIAPEISGKKLNQTEEISEGIKTRSVVGDVSPIVNFGPLTEPPIQSEEQKRQDAKEEDREVKEHEHGDSSKDNLGEVRAEESISTDLEKVISAEHKQSSTVENEPVDRTMAENTEQPIKSEKLEDEKIKGAHVGDSGTDDEKGDKHDKDAVSDSPVIVEVSKDIDVKVAHKKSHGILSGVGSKVKHSISKVKKAITGKSSHHKSESPK